MIVLFVLCVAALGVVAEAWTLMLIAGIAHFHLLEAIHPISYGVSLSFVLATLPVQILAVAMGALSDS
jgi:hypothetical protein